MCKTLGGCTKNCHLKLTNQKKIKNFNDRLLLAYNSGLLMSEIQQVNEDCDISPNIIHRREKSRIAAKKRRSKEGEYLTKLYLSLPVAPQSRLLSCDDAQFIGNFEKTTIIKVSGYVLKLYNSLSDSHFLDSFMRDHYPIVSLFSQSMFGLFWCENSSKVVFTTPGLACLTGLYWCNIIGMPLNSIILDNMDRKNLDIPSKMVFLRFVMNGLKDRGIFTVHLNKVNTNKDVCMNDNNTSLLQNGLRRDSIGKMPCSIWSSTYLGRGVHFDLIQPLTSKIISLPDKYNLTENSEPSSDNFDNNDNFDNSCVNFSPLFAVFNLNTFETISVDDGLFKSLGIRKENTDNTTLYSFFSLHCVAEISKYANKLINGESQIEQCVAQLCTSRCSVYRMAVITLQICSNNDFILPNSFNSRSSTNQGEAYSQNIVNALSSLDEISQSELVEVIKKDVKESWIQGKFQLLPKMHYDNKRDIPPPLSLYHPVRERRKYTRVLQENWPHNNCLIQYPSRISQPNPSSNIVRAHPPQHNYYCINNNQQIRLRPSMSQDYFSSNDIHRQQNVFAKSLTPETSILMRELMKPK